MSRRFSVVLLSIVVILATLFTAVPSPVLAQDGSGLMFGARPSDTSKAFFTFTMKAGESVDDKVLLINNSTNMTLNLNIILVTGETGLTGGISFDKKKDGTASWITFPGEGDHSLDSKKGQPLPFKIAVPEGTPPGEYIAGFLVSNNADKPGDPKQATPMAGATSGQGLAVQVIPRVATAIVITVPTPDNCEINVTPIKTELEEVYGRLKSTITMKHVGNLHYRGNFTYQLLPVKADGSYGDPVNTQKLYLDYVIPGDTVNYPVYISGDQLPLAGKYHVNLIFEDGCKFNVDKVSDVTLAQKNMDTTTNNAKQLATQAVPGNGQSQPAALPQWAIYVMIGFGAVIVVMLLILILLLLRRSKKDEDKA